MMERKIFARITTAFLFLLYATQINAQGNGDDYFVDGRTVFYRGQPMRGVDLRSFIILGYGYAKDRRNVYLDGCILRYVDPFTFQLKGNVTHKPSYDFDDHFFNDRYEGYLKTSNTVLFNGRVIEDAHVSSFKELTDGYARDSFNVYYMGRKVEDATSSSFRVLGNGYAEDSFNTYFRGERVK